MVTKPSKITSQKPTQRVNQLVQHLPPSGIREFFELVMGKDEVISLGVGEPDFTTPWHICEAGIYSIETGHTSYTSNSGIFELREEITAFLESKYQTSYDPKTEVLITVGGSEALDLSFRSLLEPGDEVIVIDPSFVSYAPLVILAGGIPIRISTTLENEFLPTIEQLDNALTPKTKALIINYPNNPSGASLTPSLSKALAEWVLRHNLLLISDEIYVPLSYDHPSPSFCAYPELRDHLILIHGFSKAWAMTGWRLGFACAPADIIAAMTKIHQYSIMCASTTAQKAALEALRHGDDEVSEMLREYDARRRFITHHFNRLGLKCLLPKGAFYAFPSVQSTGLTSQQFAEQLLEQENVAVVPGNAFGACGEGHVRCSYATSLEEIREAIHRIERFLNK